MKRNSGFTLIELMIVVAIIAIIAAIAIPSLLQMKKSGNEASAISSMRTICTAEIAFQNRTGEYGTLEELGDEDNPFIDAVLASGNKSGYNFTVEVTPSTDTTEGSFTCVAVPESSGRFGTGVRQFYVDQTGVIRYTADGSEPDANSDELD